MTRYYMWNVTGTVVWSNAYHDHNLLASEALRKREELWKDSPHSFICKDGEYQCKEGELVKIGEFELPEEKLYLLPKSTTVTNKNMDALKEFTSIAFAPLIDFLKREYPGQIVDKILGVMTFIGVESLDESDYFVFENTVTGKTIALTRTGRVAHHVDGALVMIVLPASANRTHSTTDLPGCFEIRYLESVAERQRTRRTRRPLVYPPAD